MVSNLQPPKFVVIGGGTGNFTVLSGLKPLVSDGLTAVVSMADDGGSSGKLRDEYGVLPPGDIRQCLAALSNATQDTRDLFTYRFPVSQTTLDKSLAGQSLGNLIISAAEQLRKGDMNAALLMVSNILAISGQVIPVTLDNSRLRITTLDGHIIDGEHAAETSTVASLRGSSVSFSAGPVIINNRAAIAIAEADMVIIAPGDLYTSIAPALVVDGMSEALSQAKLVVQVTNLMNRKHLTQGFTVDDYVTEVERLAGAPIIDYVIYNSQRPDNTSIDNYAAEGEHLVEVGDQLVINDGHYRAIGKDLLSNRKIIIDPADAIGFSRSLVRHDQDKIAQALLALFLEHQATS